MAGRPEFLSVLRRVRFSLSNGIFPSVNFKPFQVKCFESILKGQDVIEVLPRSPTNWIWQVDDISRLYRSPQGKKQLKLLL